MERINHDESEIKKIFDGATYVEILPVYKIETTYVSYIYVSSYVHVLYLDLTNSSMLKFYSVTHLNKQQ